MFEEICWEAWFLLVSFQKWGKISVIDTWNGGIRTFSVGRSNAEHDSPYALKMEVFLKI